MAYFVSVAEAMAQVGEAAGHLHARGILHRDLKPSNVMMDRAGRSYLIDFGLAADSRATPTRPPGADGPVRAEPGTVEYMAPEQFAMPGKPVGAIDARADVYSLGVTLYEFLTLRPAYRDADRMNVPSRVLAGRPTPPRELVPNVPRDLEAIVRKATHPDPAGRYPTGAEFAADLRRWLAWQSVEARPAWGTLRPLRLWARRNAGLAVAVPAVVLLLGGATARAFEQSEQRGREAERERDDLRNEAERIERERKFERELLGAQQVRLGAAYSGWSEDGLAKLREALKYRPKAELQDQAAAMLTGLDAKRVRHHDFEWPPERHGERGLSSIAFGPDGRILAGGFGRTGAHLWDGAVARPPVECSQLGVGPVAFADADTPLHLVMPDDKRWSLLLWNVATNAKVAEILLPGKGGDVRSTALSANGRLVAVSFTELATGGAPGKPVTLAWALDPKKPEGEVKKLGEWPDHVTELAFSPDGKYLAIGTETGEVTIRTVGAAGDTVQRFVTGRLPVYALAFGRNFRKLGAEFKKTAGAIPGLMLAYGTKGGHVGIVDLETGDRKQMGGGSEHDVFSVAFSPDGTVLASAGRNIPYVWDVTTGRQLLSFHGANVRGPLRSWMSGVAFSPDGSRVAFSSEGRVGLAPGGLDVFELRDGGVRTYRGLTGVVEKVWLSPTRKWVAALTQDWQLGVWDRETGRVAFVWDVPPGWTSDNSALAFDEPAGEVMLSSGQRASRWSLKTGERIGEWKMALGLNDTLAVRTDKPPLLIRREFTVTPMAGQPPQLRFLARELLGDGKFGEGYEITDLPLERIEYTQLSADGQVLLVNAVVNGKAQAILFDGLKGKKVPFDQDAVAPETAFPELSPDGAVLTFQKWVGNECKTTFVQVRDPKAVTPPDQVWAPDVKVAATHPGPLERPDETVRLGVYKTHHDPATTGVALYEVGKGRPRVTFDVGAPPIAGVWSHALSPDGRFVYWGRRDGTVCVADLNRCLEQLSPFLAR
jgi:WD40 repeat protein